MTPQFLIFIAAFFAALGIALCASPWLLRETHKDNPTRKFRWKFKALRGLVGPTNEITIKPFAGDAGGVIASRRLCFGLLIGAVALSAGMFLPHAPGVAMGLTIIVPKRGLVDRHGRELRGNYPLMNSPGARQQASANPILTNFATGIAQDLQSAIAEFLAPTVVVGSTLGHYKAYDNKNAFQVYNTARAVGGAATRIEFAATDPTYNCQPQALEVTVDDTERDAADVDDPIALDQSKIRTLVSSTVVSHETQVVEGTSNALTPEAGLGVYSDVTKDPVAEIDQLIETMSTENGMLMNRLAMGLGAWRVIKNHPKVIARQPGSTNVGVTYAQFAAMLLNPHIEIQVGILSRDTAKFGKGKTAVNIVGSKVLIFYASAAPTQYDPSFAKTFMGKRGGVTKVWSYREPRMDVHAIDWSKDIKITGTSCGKVIALS
jgi:hypothetical protein